MPAKTRLIVLYGGRSGENEVSCISAKHVAMAATPKRFEIVPIGVRRDGSWIDSKPALDTLSPLAPALVSPTKDLTSTQGISNRDLVLQPIDAVSKSEHLTTVLFSLIHGPGGEDGTVPGFSEMMNLPYVGAGILASAICMDKSLAKELCDHHKIRQTKWMKATAKQPRPRVLDQAEAKLGFPVFVKPANLGSSVGISKASNKGECDVALSLAFQYDDWVVIEKAVVGREIEVGVLGNVDPVVSVPGEIDTGGIYYDFDEKYVKGDAKLLIPAPLSKSEIDKVQALALEVFRLYRIDGMARVDFFYTQDGEFLLNEVNTIPGFTPISMYPKLFEASGIPPAILIDRLVDLALERHRQKNARRVDRG